MHFSHTNKKFWQQLDELVAASELVIDRPKGSAHPRFPEFIYPLDYGYLKGTHSADAHEIDVWVGTAPKKTVDAIMCTVDLYKKDSEIKILFSCTEQEKELVYNTHNTGPMAGLLIYRNQCTE